MKFNQTAQDFYTLQECAPKSVCGPFFPSCPTHDQYLANFHQSTAQVTFTLLWSTVTVLLKIFYFQYLRFQLMEEGCLLSKQRLIGTSLILQQLRLCAHFSRVQVRPLVWELRCHMPCSMAKNNSNNNEQRLTIHFSLLIMHYRLLKIMFIFVQSGVFS